MAVTKRRGRPAKDNSIEPIISETNPKKSKKEAIEAKIADAEAKIKTFQDKISEYKKALIELDRPKINKGKLKLGAYIAFKRNDEDKFGKITGIFIDETFQVSLCSEDKTELPIPEGAQKVRLNATIKLDEIISILP